MGITILKKSQTERSVQEIYVLCKSIENNLYFSNILEKYGRKVLTSLCQILFHTFIKKDEILFEAGIESQIYR